LFSEVATRVELCLFDDHGTQTYIDLVEEAGFCWHGYLPGIEPGQRCGFWDQGPLDPEKGDRCNPAKLPLDPYAKAVEGQVTWKEAVGAIVAYTQQQMEELRQKQEAARKRLEEMKLAGGKAWEGVKSGMDRAVEDLEKNS
jgi:pullulanase/glycogen debranching enzyme